MRFCIFFISFFLFLPSVWADLAISTDTIRFEGGDPVVGKSLTIYLSVFNFSEVDRRGVVKFFDELEGTHIGQDQTISVLAGGKDTVFVQYTPSQSGEHPIAVRILPWEEEGEGVENNKILKPLFVDEDTDGDGIGNQKDPDDDNDGTADNKDTFPLDPSEWADTDGDGTGNNTDTDDDNDTVPDVADAFPLDSGETEDFDNDGIGNNADTDDDNDDLSDDAEGVRGTDPYKFDTDGDSVGDAEDDFPLDITKTFDTDKDGIPDEDDPDDDGDGAVDSADSFPRDASETSDVDNDGIGDNADADDDNDGFFDEEEVVAGTDPLKNDSDGDGFEDGEDDLPLDPTEHKDSDHDGLGDNADKNDSNPGPILSVSASSEQVEKGQKVYFDASSSYDPDGGPLTYEWHFPDGTVRNGSRVEYLMNRSGTRHIELIVTDSAGEPRTKILTVNSTQGRWDRIFWVFVILLVLISFAGSGGKRREKPKKEESTEES